MSEGENTCVRIFRAYMHRLAAHTVTWHKSFLSDNKPESLLPHLSQDKQDTGHVVVGFRHFNSKLMVCEESDTLENPELTYSDKDLVLSNSPVCSYTEQYEAIQL